MYIHTHMSVGKQVYTHLHGEKNQTYTLIFACKNTSSMDIANIYKHSKKKKL